MKSVLSTIREFPELANEQLVLLANINDHYPVPISRPSAERAWRHGCRGVRLETVYLNGRRYTSVEAINRYINQTQRTGEAEPSNKPTPSGMSQRDLEAARRKFNMPVAGKDGVAVD